MDIRFTREEEKSNQKVDLNVRRTKYLRRELTNFLGLKNFIDLYRSSNTFTGYLLYFLKDLCCFSFEMNKLKTKVSWEKFVRPIVWGIDVTLCVDVFTIIDLAFPEKIVNFRFVQIFNS